VKGATFLSRYIYYREKLAWEFSGKQYATSSLFE
jgi:hypothetical protein